MTCCFTPSQRLSYISYVNKSLTKDHPSLKTTYVFFFVFFFFVFADVKNLSLAQHCFIKSIQSETSVSVPVYV